MKINNSPVTERRSRPRNAQDRTWTILKRITRIHEEQNALRTEERALTEEWKRLRAHGRTGK